AEDMEVKTKRYLPLSPPCPPWWSVVICALALVVTQASAQRAPSGPIKIGFLTPLSGPYVQNGRDILNGFLLYLDEIGYKIAGRSIELIVEDDEAIPAVGLTKARKLVERDKVHLLAGAPLSSSGFTLAPSVGSVRLPVLYPL